MSICKQELLTVLFYGLWISCNKGDNKISSICSFIWQSFAHIKTFLIVWRLPQLEWNIHLIERFYLTCETTSINHQCLKLTPENVWLFGTRVSVRALFYGMYHLWEVQWSRGMLVKLEIGRLFWVRVLAVTLPHFVLLCKTLYSNTPNGPNWSKPKKGKVACVVALE